MKLRHDPESRAIAGISSGGICAWTVAWERPDEFRKVLSWVGSFTNIASGKTRREGGHNYEALIRKTPKKPIRVFLQDGANDLDNANGNWPLANQQMAKALEFAGYDYQVRLRPGLPQQPPRPRHPARLAPLALARLQAGGRADRLAVTALSRDRDRDRDRDRRTSSTPGGDAGDGDIRKRGWPALHDGPVPSPPDRPRLCCRPAEIHRRTGREASHEIRGPQTSAGSESSRPLSWVRGGPPPCHCATTSAPRSPIGDRGMGSTADGP